MNSTCYQANKGFNFNIYTPTCDEAFKLLSNNLRQLSWYQKKWLFVPNSPISKQSLSAHSRHTERIFI